MFSDEASQAYDALVKHAKNSKKARMILAALLNKLDLILENPRYGNPLAKRLIPKEYKLRYKAKNLFRVELPCFWRMLYSLTNDEIEIIALVVDVVDHKDYNKKFSYD